MTGQTNSLNSSTASLPNEDSSWVDLEIKENQEEKERHSSGDSGVEDQPGQESSAATTLEFQLTQSLLDQVRVGKDNTNANSGKQACRDLPTMTFIINDIGICKETVKQWLEDVSENLGYLMRAEHAFTKMFESVLGAKVPCPLIILELIRSCNQAGHEALIYDQIHPIFAQYKLIPTIPEKTISIRCNSVNSLNVEYNEVMVVKNSDPDQPKQYKSGNKLEFTLKLHDGKIEYENGKVTFTIPEELKKYHANDKSLLDNINKHFADADNSVIESFVENIGEGTRSFVVEPVENSSDDEGLSFVEVSGSLADLEELVKKAVQGKDVSALSSYVKVVEDRVTSAQPELIDKLIQILNQFLQQENAGRGGAYPTFPPGAEQVHAVFKWAEGKINGNISDDDYEIVQGLVSQLKHLLENKNVSVASPTVVDGTEPECSNAEQMILAKSEEEATINSTRPIQESISNNSKGGEMGKKQGNNNRSKGQKKNNTVRFVEEDLDCAIQNIDLQQVQHLVNQGAAVTQYTLGKANGRLESLRSNNFSNSKNDSKKKDQVNRITKIMEFLENNLSTPVNDDNHNEVESNAAVDDQIAAGHPDIYEAQISKLMDDVIDNVVKIVDDPESEEVDESLRISLKSQPNGNVVIQEDGGESSTAILTSSDDEGQSANPGASDVKVITASNETPEPENIVEDVPDEGDRVVSKANGENSDNNQQNTQPKTLAIDYELNNATVEGDNIETPFTEQTNDTQGNGQPSDQVKNSGDTQASKTASDGETPEQEYATVEDVLIDENEEEELYNARQVPVIVDTTETAILKQARSSQNNGQSAPHPSNPDKNSQSAQKSKKWPTIAISTLTVAAVASVALSIYFEMLTIGLAVGACCLVAAAIVYCCKPASLLEDSNAKASANSVPVVQ